MYVADIVPDTRSGFSGTSQKDNLSKKTFKWLESLTGSSWF